MSEIERLTHPNVGPDALRRAVEILNQEKAELHAENERLRTALDQIEVWSHAYPISVFPEPDFGKAHELLKAGGMTLDAISASAMRHVVTEVGKMARDALGGERKDKIG